MVEAPEPSISQPCGNKAAVSADGLDAMPPHGLRTATLEASISANRSIVLYVIFENPTSLLWFLLGCDNIRAVRARIPKGFRTKHLCA